MAQVECSLLRIRREQFPRGHTRHDADDRRSLRAAHPARFQIVADGLARNAHRLRHLTLPNRSEQDLTDFSYFKRRQRMFNSHVIIFYTSFTNLCHLTIRVILQKPIAAEFLAVISFVIPSKLSQIDITKDSTNVTSARLMKDVSASFRDRLLASDCGARA